MLLLIIVASRLNVINLFQFSGLDLTLRPINNAYYLKNFWLSGFFYLYSDCRFLFSLCYNIKINFCTHWTQKLKKYFSDF